MNNIKDKAIKFIFLLHDRLSINDQRRESVQQDLKSKIAVITNKVNEMREEMLQTLDRTFEDNQERLMKTLDELNRSETTENDIAPLITHAYNELASLKSASILKPRSLIGGGDDKTLNNLLSIHFANVVEVNWNEINFDDKNNTGISISILKDKIKIAINEQDNNRASVTEEINRYSGEFLRELALLYENVNLDLEPRYVEEDERLQKFVSGISEYLKNANKEGDPYLSDLLNKARAALIIEKNYIITENTYRKSLKDFYVLKVTETIHGLERMRPENVRVKDFACGKIFLDFDKMFDPDEENVLRTFDISNQIKINVCIQEKEEGNKEIKENLDKSNARVWELDKVSRFFSPFYLKEETSYSLRAWIEYDYLYRSDSGYTTFKTPNFSKCCTWKKGERDDHEGIFSLSKDNKTATMKVDRREKVICGNMLLPANKVTSWGIKILKSKKNDGNGIYTGVACHDFEECLENESPDCKWWCVNWFDFTLHSGPPHNYEGKEYGPRKRRGEYVSTGDIVGVVMDTAKGDLSFILNGVNYGVAYEGVPLDKPLVPYVFLYNKYDSIELDTSEVKENVDKSIFIPSNITTKSNSWDSITLVWENVEGASFYHIKVDENNSFYISTTNTFTKKELHSETEHSFRVRTVKDNSVGDWSDPVKGRTMKAPNFSECVWKDCPDNALKFNAYYVDEYNPRIASIGNYCSAATIIGDTTLPLNKVSSWDIDIIKLHVDNSNTFYVGIAPFDINQNEENNYNKCGWYLYCHSLTLWSGPPHNYKRKEYGPNKKYVKYYGTRNTISVAMNTVEGKLLFAVDGVGYGVGYENIPLDKPLVPCVILSGSKVFVKITPFELDEN